MMRIVVAVIVVFLIIGCDINRHQYMEWPAQLVSVADFSEQEHNNVIDIIDEFNERAHQNLIVQDESETHSTILIKWRDNIPKLTGAVAGRATLEPDQCVVEISSVVSSSEKLLKPVLWHELGHCAGLEHDSKKGELMYKEAFSYTDYEPTAIDRFFSLIIAATSL